MGNVLEHASSTAIDDAEAIEEDLKWLGVKGSMMFNDVFLEEEYTKLPRYDGTEVLPDLGGDGSPGLLGVTAVGTAGGLRGQNTVRRMLQLLGPQEDMSGEMGADTGSRAGAGTSVEDFPPLLGDSYLRASTHSAATRMRSRLFQRMHLALMRQAYRAMTSLAAEAAGKAGSRALVASSTFALPPSSTAGDIVGESDPTAILTSASMRLTLTLMGSLRATVPGLFTSMAQTLMDLFVASAPFALGKVGSSSAYFETLSQVRKLAERVAAAESGSPADERAQAAALLLSLGVATGCISDVIGVARLLLERGAPALPPSARASVERLRDQSTTPKTSLPKPGAWTASFPARLDSAGTEDASGSSPTATQGGGRGGSAGFSDRRVTSSGGCSNPATDGVYVYVWDADFRRVHKVGTGFHGTLEGNVYCSSKGLLDEIRVFKGMQPAEEFEGEDEDDDHPVGRGETATSQAPGPPRHRSAGDAGVVISDAAAQRRRSMMGTGLNIGGGLGMGGGGTSDSDYSDGGGYFGLSGLLNAVDLETAGTPTFGLESEVVSSSSSSSPSSESSSSASASSGGLPPPASLPAAVGAGPAPPPLPPARTGIPGTPLPSLRPGAIDTALGVHSPAHGRGNADAVPPLSSSSQQQQQGDSGNVRLHRVPFLRGRPHPGEDHTSWTPPERAGSTSGSPPRGAMDAILGALGTMRAREGGTRVGLATTAGAETVGSLGVVGGDGGGEDWRGDGLLRFRALGYKVLLPRIPEDGVPQEDVPDVGENLQAMLEDDEGDILETKVVHGFRWYKVRVTTRAVSTQALNIVGWVPLKTVEDSDFGSLDSEEIAELEGDEFIEILDPTTGEMIDPDSPRALNPPMWDEAREAAAEAAAQAAAQDVGAGREGRRDLRGASTGTPGANGGGPISVVRPVWLALASGKLFVREKASGSLSANEIAVLRLSDLSLDYVVGLADLPIPGFPKSSREAVPDGGSSPSPPGKGLEREEGAGVDAQEEAGGGEEKEEGGEEEKEDEEELMQFAYADLGAFVAECSSNSETSGGLLQNNLLQREASDRLPFPSFGNLGPLDTDTAFSFHGSDHDRVIVVDLGQLRRVREAGVELFPAGEPSGVSVVDACMSSLLVETSRSGNAWTTLGRWTAPGGDATQDDADRAACTAKVTTTAGSEHLARLVRYTLVPNDAPAGTPLAPCWLARLLASGPGGGVPGESCAGEEEKKNDLPFPAMTTDSRHIILVHLPEGRGEEKEEAAESGAAALAEASPRRLEIFFLDPEDEYRLVRTVKVTWDLGDEADLHKAAILCDGDRLVALTHKDSAVVKRTADTAVVAMRCSSTPFAASVDGDDHDVEGQDAATLQEDMEFDVRSAGGLAPTGLGYDCRNNVMWGWDSILKKLCRWRSDGLSPVFAPPRPAVPVSGAAAVSQGKGRSAASPGRADAIAAAGGVFAADAVLAQASDPAKQRVAWARHMLSSPSPSRRVEGLEAFGFLDAGNETRGSGDGILPALRAKGQAALLLGYLERLGEPHGPPEEPVAEHKVRCELEAASGGKDDGNFSRLLVRGEDRSCKEPGLNVLVLTDALDAGGELAKGFATHESLHASNRLADYLNAIPHGRTVLIAAQEDAGGNLSNSAKKALLSVGAGKAEVAGLQMHRRSSFAMIGRKGAKPGSVPQVLRLPKKGCATTRQRLPAPRVPMCVDVSKETLNSLVAFILQHESVLLQPTASPTTPAAAMAPTADLGGVAESTLAGGGLGGGVGQSELDAAVLLSAVNILTNQMFQLIRGSTPAAARALFSPEHVGPLLALLIAVIDQDQPALGEQQRATQPTSSPHEHSADGGVEATEEKEEEKEWAAVAVGGGPPSASDAAGNAVRRVSCAGAAGRASFCGDGGDAGGAEARRDLLQRACLRLFVTGMDLFFPSCAQRCSLLARNLSKYIRNGLSPARETVLELLLRRMSDPGQLVELVSRVPPQCAASPSAGADAAAAAANPFVVVPATPPAAVVSTPAYQAASSGEGGADVTQKATAMVGAPAPSAIELQCLLLSVATAEGVSKLKALQQRDGAGHGGNGGYGGKDSGRRSKREGALQGDVGEAAVEMLGRLTNQLLSSAACVIMESDLAAFNEGYEDEVDGLLQAIGVPPFSVPYPADNAAATDGSAGAKVTAGLDSNAAAAAAKSIESPWLGTDVSAASTLVVLVVALCRSCAALASQAVETAEALSEGLVDGESTLPKEADRILQESPLGALLPMLASSLALLVEKHGAKMQGRLSRMAQEIIGVMKVVSMVLERVPKDLLSMAGVSKGVGTVTKSVVMESKHNYEALTDEMLYLEIAGASKMVVTFDERSRTEDGYDYLIFWKDESKTKSWHPSISKFSGTGGSCNFPGFGGRAPLVIESDRCWVEWRTDGSNEDWGWKFTATSEVKKVASGGDGGGYWLLGLDRQLAGAGAALAGCLVISKPWGGKAEDDNAPWMEDDLLAGAVPPEVAAAAVARSPAVATVPNPTSVETACGAVSAFAGVSAGRLPRETSGDDGRTGSSVAADTAPPCRELLLLLELVERLEGTGGSALWKAMRARVGEDQGSVEPVNRAVYATCAALIWHQGLGAEALALAEGRVTAPSKALSKAWRFGQQMRQFFDYGDVRDAVNCQMELQRKQAVAMEMTWKSSSSAASLTGPDPTPSTRPILARGPSVYQGAEEKVIAEVSERIVSRARFLLSLPSQATRVSLQEQSKRRWSILARLGGVEAMPRTPSQSNYLGDGAELLEKWKDIVDEATAIQKLKSILVYRRKAAEMRERAKQDSVSERIMKFAQCPTDVSELEMVRQCRDQRAKLRAEGLRLTRALVSAAASPPAKAWLLSSHAQSIRLTKRDDRPGAHVHFLSSVEGCEPSAYSALARQFALLVKSSLEVLKDCSRPKNGETPAQAAERRALAVSSLQALAIDYDLRDHEILKESILLEVLEPLLQGFNEPDDNAAGTAAAATVDDAPPPADNGGDQSEELSRTEPAAEQGVDVGGEGGEGDGRSSRGGDEDDDGSIANDIAALEAELQEEEGLLANKADGGDGGGGGSSYLPGDDGSGGGNEASVRKAAWCLFEVLLPRCVGLEGQGPETRFEEPTSFSHRLLAVLIRQVGRASANVEVSNTSLGTYNRSRPAAHTGGSTPPAPALGGAESGGPDASGRGAGTAAFPKATPLLLHGMRLRRDQAGLAAAHRDMSVRHSLSLWLRRDSCPLDTKPGAWYSPARVGDTVARGPKWPRGDISDGGPGGLGTVVELTKSNMTAKVQWDITGYNGTYKMGAMAEFSRDAEDESAPASVDDLLVWEVVKVDPTVGGSVVMKGGVSNLSKEERSEPWSQFGLSLLGNATLMYYAVAGEDQLFTLHSRTMLQPDVWTHVAVVQAKSRCRIYIDGEEDGEETLPKHMLIPGGMVKDVLESQHPYANNMDKMWEVHVEGAVSYSITFDPLTKTEPNHDYVRFLKDASDQDGAFFGESRYSGGRNRSESNWPGMGGRPPLVIEAPSFVVYFHTDQSNNDWGFKLTSAACVSAPAELDEDMSEASTANLNPFPVYLGQPPSYASSQRSASGYLWGASTYAEVLTAEQIRDLARAPPPPEPSFMEEEACIDVLSLVQRCALSMDGAVSQGGGLSLEPGASPLVSPEVLGPLLVILLRGSLKLRLAAARLCERLLPQAPLEMVQVQLSRAGLSFPLVLPPPPGKAAREAPLVRGLMLQLGETLSVWSRLAAGGMAAATGAEARPPRRSGPPAKESLTAGEEAVAMSSGNVGLLRALLAREGWSAPLADCLREACSDLPAVTKHLEEAGSWEIEEGCSERVLKVLHDPKLWMVHACLALLGGSFQGLHVGGRAMALIGDGDGATLERCTVLAMDWPRPHHLAAIEWHKSLTTSKAANKGVDFVCPASEWEELKSLGDAVIVCLHSEPETPRVLPRGRVSPDTAMPSASFLSALNSPPHNLQSPLRGAASRELSAAAEAAVAAARAEGTPGLVPYVPEGLVEPLVEAFGVLSVADATEKRERYKPLVVETDQDRILESPHPHGRGVDELYPLDFPGADSIQLFFDEDCRTEEGTYIRIYKDDTRTGTWGESFYQGRDKDANWPGLHGRPAVCVPASSCVIKFHSEDRNPDWGFRITAKARCKNFTLPPERPPLLGTSALSTLQACGAKALVTLVTSWPHFVPHAQPLIKSLAERALGSQGSEEDLKKMAAPQPTKVVVESEHPYSHNADRKETVRIEGAKKLLVSFDERSRTEHGCDFMVFYADETMSKVYGESKYTGGKDGHLANWPGTGGRPPLEIPASMFFFRWQTDRSVNDWGWRMTVTPVMDKMDSASLPLPMLDSKLASLLRICHDRPKEQSPAVGLEKFEVDPASTAQPSSNLPSSLSSSSPLSSSAASVPIKWDPLFAARSANFDPPGALAVDSAASAMLKIPRVLRNYRPRLFVVNPRDAEEVSLRDSPRSDSGEIGKVSVKNGQVLLALNEVGDWLNVVPIVGPAEVAIQHLSDLWGRLAETREARGEDPPSKEEAEEDARVFESVTRAALGPFYMEGKSTASIMWALRRQGDMLYLVPREEASSHLVTIPDEGDLMEIQAAKLGAGGAEQSVSSAVVAAAYQVLDPPQADEAGPASRGAFGVQAGAELACESHRLWSALAETSRATASRFSRIALTRILAGSAEVSSDGAGGGTSPPLVLDDYGGPHVFLRLLRATFAEARGRGSEIDTEALEVLKKKILAAVRQTSAEGREVADMLVAFSLYQLTIATSLAKYLCPTKAVVRTFETSHNYADNTDTYTKISIPGAKRIRVVFDEKCSTEMGCDFVRIYKDAQHNSYWGEHEYTGPATSHAKVWAGVGGRPPLMVEADTMEVHFHSDSSNNDWGVRMNAFGILQEPTAQQRSEYRNKRKELGDPEVELSCWLLEALAKESEGRYVRYLMHQRSTMETLARFLEAADTKAKIWVVRLLTSLLQSSCPPKRPASPSKQAVSPRTPAVEPATEAEAAGVTVPDETGGPADRLEVMFEPGGPVSVLVDLANKESSVEEDRGTDAKSPLLQALVQACLVADECKMRALRASPREGPDVSCPRWPHRANTTRSADGRSICADPNSAVDMAPLLAEPGYPAPASTGGRGVMRWHLQVLGVSTTGPRIGIGQPASKKTAGVATPPWSLTWDCIGSPQMSAGRERVTSLPYAPVFKSRDMVTLEVDAVKKEVRFYRNQSLVGLAFGPPGSNAWVEHGETWQFPPWRDGDALHLAVVLLSPNDGAQIVPPPLPLCPSIASLSPSGDASWWGAGAAGVGGLEAARGEHWLGCVRESVELMSAVLNRELPPSFVAEELLPKCQQRSAVTLESAHPLGASPSDETVTIPGATSLEVVFDARTAMGPGDIISIFAYGGREPERVLQGLSGATESLLGSARSVGSSGYAVGGISVGDIVVRGPSWNWGEHHDGGPGCYGTVIDIRTWKGRPRSGIKVRWNETSFVGLYRWDHEGCFDVLVVAHGRKSTKPIVIKGNSLSIRVEPDAVSKATLTQSSSDACTPRLNLQNGASVLVKLAQSVVRDLLFGEFTVEAWFRIEANASGCLDFSTCPLLSRGIMQGLSQINLKAVSSPDRRRSTVDVEMHAGDMSTALNLSGGTLTPGHWGHVAFSIDMTGTARLIVDGTEVASGQFTGPRMLLEDCDLLVGESLDSVGTLSGYVYDLRIWARALNVADVAAGLKALPAIGSYGLAVNFPFTEGHGKVMVNRGSYSDVTARPNLACTWSSNVDPPVETTLSHWGWRCTVTPIYRTESLDRMPVLKQELETFRSFYGSGDIRHDLALVRYVNAFAEKKSFDANLLLRCSWDELTPSEEDLVREPLLRELCLWRSPTAATAAPPRRSSFSDVTNAEGRGRAIGQTNRVVDAGVEESKGEGGTLLAETKDGKGEAGDPGDGKHRGGVGGGSGGSGARGPVRVAWGKKEGGVAARFEVLQQLNKKLREALPYLDLTQVDRKWSAAHLLSSCRGLIFRAVKEPVLLDALSKTACTDGGQFDLHLSRSKAARHIHLGHTDTKGRWSVFGQAFRQMNTMHPRSLRTHSKLYNCVFMGERSQDAGGPYRESWSMYAQELQSTALPLLIRTPNGVHAAGVGRDRYVPNPGATSPAQVEMFTFLGKMMGHAIRSKEYIGLNLSVVVWKALVGQEVQLPDLENVDILLTRSMQDIRTIDQKGVTRAIFSDIVMENFTALSLDDREVELKPGGKNIPVTWENRMEYADLVEKQRLSECCAMVKHIRKGLSMVIPLAVLAMFNWDEVECLVCGKPEVDVDLLETIAEYSGCRKEQPHIKLFWQALREFTPHERSMLIKFTWGRTRLPLTAEGFSQRFKLQSFGRSPADDYLPVAHTCFFSLELPAYSSLEVMKERLLFAAFNCSTIDGDDNFAGMNAAALGWDWDEDDDGEDES